MKYKYDPESDILAVTLKDRPFSYAQEAEDFVVHYDDKNTPVYVEILNAHAFLSNALHSLPNETLKETISST